VKLTCVQRRMQNNIPTNQGNQAPASSTPDENLLVDINEIGSAIFGDKAPSVRTLRTLTRAGVLPYFRIGKLIRYDVRLVRAALELHCLVRAKKTGAR